MISAYSITPQHDLYTVRSFCNHEKSRGHKRGEIWKEEEMKEGIFNSLPKQSFHLTCTKRIKRFKMTKRYDVFLQTWLQRLRQRWEKSIRNPLKKKKYSFPWGICSGLWLVFIHWIFWNVHSISGENKWWVLKKKKWWHDAVVQD